MTDPRAMTAARRTQTEQLLSAVAPPDGGDHDWAAARAFLAREAAAGAHLVASAVVVGPGGQLLLGRHERYAEWGPFGGHVDEQDRTLVDTAEREVAEETGLRVRVHPAPVDVRLSEFRCGGVSSPCTHLDVRFAAVPIELAAVARPVSELLEIGWFDLSALPWPLTPGTADLALRARAVVQDPFCDPCPGTPAPVRSSPACPTTSHRRRPHP